MCLCVCVHGEKKIILYGHVQRKVAISQQAENDRSTSSKWYPVTLESEWHIVILEAMSLSNFERLLHFPCVFVFYIRGGRIQEKWKGGASRNMRASRPYFNRPGFEATCAIRADSFYNLTTLKLVATDLPLIAAAVHITWKLVTYLLWYQLFSE